MGSIFFTRVWHQPQIIISRCNHNRVWRGGTPKRLVMVPVGNRFNTKCSLVSHVKISHRTNSSVFIRYFESACHFQSSQSFCKITKITSKNNNKLEGDTQYFHLFYKSWNEIICKNLSLKLTRFNSMLPFISNFSTLSTDLFISSFVRCMAPWCHNFIQQSHNSDSRSVSEIRDGEDLWQKKKKNNFKKGIKKNK